MKTFQHFLNTYTSRNYYPQRVLVILTAIIAVNTYCALMMYRPDILLPIWQVLTHFMEKAMAPHSSTLAWKLPWTEEPGRLQSMGSRRVKTRLSNFTFTFHFHALEKEIAPYSSVLAWRIPGTEEPGRLPSTGSHRVRHDWSDFAATHFIRIR